MLPTKENPRTKLTNVRSWLVVTSLLILGGAPFEVFPQAAQASTEKGTIPAYRNIWWRQIPGSTSGHLIRLAILKGDQPNPPRAAEVYLLIDSNMPDTTSRRVTIQEFFGGQVLEVRRVLSESDLEGHYLLLDGTRLELVFMDRGEIAQTDAEGQAEQLPPPGEQFRVMRISAFGLLPIDVEHDPQRVWIRPSVERATVLDSSILGCDQFDWGIEAFDRNAKRLWQLTIVAYGETVAGPRYRSGKSGADPFSYECWLPGQHEIATVQTTSIPLHDGTMLAVLGSSSLSSLGVVRIRLKDGRPDRIPPNLNVLDYAGVMRLKAVLAGVQLERDAHTNRIEANTQRTNFSILQYYFFPDLMHDSLRTEIKRAHPK